MLQTKLLQVPGIKGTNYKIKWKEHLTSFTLRLSRNFNTEKSHKFMRRHLVTICLYERKQKLTYAGFKIVSKSKLVHQWMQ